jgi:hypothetical protein
VTELPTRVVTITQVLIPRPHAPSAALSPINGRIVSVTRVVRPLLCVA